MSRYWVFYVFALGIASLNANEYFLEEEISESMESIELDDFDSEGISLFGMELDDGEELLFPWGGREEFSAFIEEKARAALKEVDELFVEDEVAGEMTALPSEEKIPTRSNRLLSSRPRIVPSNK
jgi:hypothetical protein